MSSLSIIVLTYNPGMILTECLTSISGGGHEIILVDNGSSDGTPDRVRESFPDVRVIISPTNGGFAAGNNQGLAVARGDYLLLLNPDVIVAPGALDALIACMDAHPEVGIVGCRTFDAQGQIALTAFGEYAPLTLIGQYWGLTRLFPTVGFGVYAAQCATASEPFHCAWVQGHCLLIRRAVYAQIGGLDEGFFMFAEEPDYCQRARQAGWSVLFTPDAQVIHHESSTVSRYPLLKMRHYHISPLYYFRKRGRRGAVIALKLGFTLELVFKLGLRIGAYVLKRSPALRAKIAAYPVVLREMWAY